MPEELHRKHPHEQQTGSKASREAGTRGCCLRPIRGIHEDKQTPLHVTARPRWAEGCPGE